MAVIFHPESDCHFVGVLSEHDANQGCHEVPASSLPAGTRLPSGCGFTTVLPDLDFETYSEAGNVWDETVRKWRALPGATKRGLPAVGAAPYAEHASTEVLSLAYNLKAGEGAKLWIPGMPPPVDLFDHIKQGGLLEAWNCAFEWYIWTKVCAARYGWPGLPFWQLRDAMAKSRAFSLPGALAKAADVTGAAVQKDKEGTRLLNKFSKPRNPTKNDSRKRIKPEEDREDANKLYAYNLTDIEAESAVSIEVPDLPPEETEFWLCTLASNIRGVQIDMAAVNDCAHILDQAYVMYDAELAKLTGGQVQKASEVAKLKAWLEKYWVFVDSLDADAIEKVLKTDVPPEARRALEIRQMTGSAGVKKIYAMQRRTNSEGRANDLFIYHGARTGRDTGADIQPQNLVKAGPKLRWCENYGCEQPYGGHHKVCPFCGTSADLSNETGWTWKAVDSVLKAISTRSLEYVEWLFGDAVLAVSGCVRGMFTAGPGKDLICSDYSSIEAVVTAVLSGEEWRIEAFRQKQDIYLVSASKTTGTPVEVYLAYKRDRGEHHPDRQKYGKPRELALGFAGWLAAYRQFDDTDTFTDWEVKEAIKEWRETSPMIVEMWGGQVRGKPWAPERYELFGLEGAAISAVQNPGQCFSYRSISYGVKNNTLFCKLPSGRFLTYHRPQLGPSARWEGQLELSFEGWNSNPKMGPIGWIRIQTYGGRLMENVVQAVARDILRDATIRAERKGYPIVLRVHDELVAEVPAGTGSIEEFEALMATLPPWAAGWPIRAAGGWRGKRYRKE